MNLNNLSWKKRLLGFAIFCWLSFVGVIAADNYSGFDTRIFIFYGVVPILFIFGFVWTVKGYLLENPSSKLTTILKHTDRKKSLNLIAKIVGWFLGFTLMKIFGYTLWIPLIIIGLIIKVFEKLDKNKTYESYYRFAISILAGHFIWISAGVIYTQAFNTYYILYLSGMALAVFLMILKPQSRNISIMISALQIFFISRHFTDLFENSDQKIALIVHIALRATFVFLIAYNYFNRKHSSISNDQKAA